MISPAGSACFTLFRRGPTPATIDVTASHHHLSSHASSTASAYAQDLSTKTGRRRRFQQDGARAVTSPVIVSDAFDVASWSAIDTLPRFLLSMMTSRCSSTDAGSDAGPLFRRASRRPGTPPTFSIDFDDDFRAAAFAEFERASRDFHARLHGRPQLMMRLCHYRPLWHRAAAAIHEAACLAPLWHRFAGRFRPATFEAQPGVMLRFVVSRFQSRLLAG